MARKVLSAPTDFRSNPSKTTKKAIEQVLERTVYNKPLKNEMISHLMALCSMYSPTGEEREVVDYCVNVLRSAGFKVFTDKVDNVFAVRGNNGDSLVCINAHTDTVQTTSDVGIEKTVRYQWWNDVISGNGKMVAGDDKCGIALALTLASYTTLPMKIILTSGEERGGTGAAELTQSDFKDVAFCFTIDRKGGSDIISEYCGKTCAPKEFVDAFIDLSLREVGLKFAVTGGSYADTYTISDFTPCVNLSAGYYNAHTKDDFIDVEELYRVMMCVKSSIEYKDILVHALSTAPSDWRKDIHAGDSDWVRGKYVGKTSYYNAYEWSGYGGYGVYYGKTYQAKEKENDNNWGAWRNHRASSDSYVRSGKKNESISTGKTCHVKFDKTRGRDDVSETKNTVEDHKPLVMSRDEGELFAKFNDGHISDTDWDSLLMNGRISAQIHRVGVEKQVRERNAKLEYFLRERNKEDFLNERRNPFNTASQEDEENRNDSALSLLAANVKNDLLGGSPDTLLGSITEDDLTGFDDLQPSEDDEEDIEELARVSGFLPGSIEHSIFVDYVSGHITRAELEAYVIQGYIGDRLFEMAVDAFDARQLKILYNRAKSNRVKELEEELEYSVNKGNQSTQKKKSGKKRRGKKKRGGKGTSDTSSFNRNSYTDNDMLHILDYVDGHITNNEWKSKMMRFEISEDVYYDGLYIKQFKEDNGIYPQKFIDYYEERYGNTEESGDVDGEVEVPSPTNGIDRSSYREFDYDCIYKYATGDTIDTEWEDMLAYGITDDGLYKDGVVAKKYYIKYGVLPKDLATDYLSRSNKTVRTRKKPNKHNSDDDKNVGVEKFPIINRSNYTAGDFDAIFRFAYYRDSPDNMRYISAADWDKMYADGIISNYVHSDGMYVLKYFKDSGTLPEDFLIDESKFKNDDRNGQKYNKDGSPMS